mgnify:FL=1
MDTSTPRPERIGSEEDMAQLIEIMADVEHDRWAKWHRYFISKCSVKQHEVGGMDDRFVYLALPKDLSERWTRQCDTKYSDLSDEEKESDRREVQNTLNALSKVKAKMYIDRTENTGKQGL